LSRPFTADTDPQREKNKQKLIRLIETSPGGITSADIKSVMGDLKQTAVTALMNSLNDSLALWEEVDESGDTWYHHPKFNELYYNDRKGVTIMDNLHGQKDNKYKRGRKSRNVSIEESTYLKVLKYCADRDCSMIDFLTDAAEEKIAKAVRK